MRYSLIYAVIATLAISLFFRPIVAQADEGALSVNDSYFDGVPMDPSMEVLTVYADPSALRHGEADAELIQYAAPESERKADSCGLDTSPPVPFTLDCGVKMLGVEINADKAIYFFLLKSRRDDWYQLLLSPQSGAATWIKDPHDPGLILMVQPFVNWLRSRDSLTVTHEIADPVRAVPVLKKPDDKSEDLTDCAGYEDREGVIPAEDKAIQGDWLHVACLENECYAQNDPVRKCLPKLNPKGIPCAEGWTRWRTKTGRLLLYPHDASAQACSWAKD